MIFVYLVGLCVIYLVWFSG